MPRSSALKVIDSFNGLPTEALRSIEQRCQWLDMRPGQQIVDRRDDEHSVFFLVKGQAVALLLTASGRNVELDHLGAGQIFGELAAIDDQPRSASVVAVTCCRVARMGSAEFRGLLEHEPLVMHAVMRHLAGKIRTLTGRVFELSVLPVPARLQTELMRIALDGHVAGDTAVVRRLPTHTELASRIATAREVVSREINRLERQGFIERHGTTLRVPSLSRLDDLVRTALGEVAEPNGVQTSCDNGKATTGLAEPSHLVAETPLEPMRRRR